MSPKCEIVAVSPVVLALTEAEVRRSEIAARILPMFDIVYSWLRGSGIRQAGHNYAIYDRCAADSLRLRVGVPVAERFDDTDLVKCADLAPGRAARALHVGPYRHLPATYAALDAWCRGNAPERVGESWEEYGDWTEDESKLETWVFQRLRNV